MKTFYSAGLMALLAVSCGQYPPVGPKKVLVVAPPVPEPQPVVAALEDVSVTIKAGTSQGSGILVTRGERTFVWTAAHVIASFRSGSHFADPSVIRIYIEDGREVGQVELTSRVLRWSDPEHGEDLALLEVRKRNITSASATFYTQSILPPLGSELYNVGSMFGVAGAGSVSTGVYSAYGRIYGGVVFDQTTVKAVPGSSGSGVFLRDGQCVGMAVRIIDEAYSANLIVPIRRMRAWAKRVGIEWALDPSLPVPVEIEPLFEFSTP